MNPAQIPDNNTETEPSTANLSEHARWNQKDALKGIAVILTIATLLSTSVLKNWAQRLDYGSSRSVAIGFADSTHLFSSVFGLDIPNAEIKQRTETLWGRTNVAITPPSTVAVRKIEPAAPALTTTTVKPPLPRRQITQTNKLRIWSGGDSLGEFIGNRFINSAKPEDNFESIKNYQISTGLTRPEFYDWPANFKQDIESYNPDVAVFMIGGNDDKNILKNGKLLVAGSKEWLTEYELRVQTIVNIALDTDTELYWVELPPMRDAEREALSTGMNSVFSKVAKKYSQVNFFEIDAYVTDDTPGYVSYATGPDGKASLVRSRDGVHITRDPSEWIADDLIKIFVETWKLDEVSSPTPSITTTTTPKQLETS